jgi:hypothetical protein
MNEISFAATGNLTADPELRLPRPAGGGRRPVRGQHPQAHRRR